MVTLRMWTAVVMCAALGRLAAPVSAAEPTEYERRARAAFAFATASRAAPRAVPAAPPPRAIPEPAVPRLIGYREVCSNGRCYLIPVYAP